MARSGLTRTAFYRYFPDLETVLRRGLADVNRELGAASELWLAESADPQGGLLPAAIAFTAVFRDHGRLLLASADAATGAPELEATWRALVDGFTARTLRRVEDLCGRGLCSIDDPAETCRALVWMTERYLLETFGRSRRVPVGRAAGAIALIWRRTLFYRPGEDTGPERPPPSDVSARA